MRNLTSRVLQIGRKLEKWQWCQNLLIWRHLKTFWCCFDSLVKLSCWSKFQVNVITGSVVLTIFFFKGCFFVQYLETGMSLMKYYWMLQNAKVTAFTISELLRENQQRSQITPTTTQISIKWQSSFIQYIQF